MMRVIVVTLTGDLEENLCQAVIYEKLLGTCCDTFTKLDLQFSDKMNELIFLKLGLKF